LLRTRVFKHRRPQLISVLDGQYGERRRSYDMMLLSLAMLVAVDASACGSSEVARSRLAAKVALFQSGMTAKAVTTAVGLPAAGWSKSPGKDEGPWILVGRDGRRVATVSLDCDFNRSGRLVGCRSVVEQWEQQQISEAVYESVKQGDSLDAVVGQLCEPGARRTRDDGLVVLDYWVLHPKARYNKDCPAYLGFRDGRLTSKEEQCR
jgi:hypothetical protein